MSNSPAWCLRLVCGESICTLNMLTTDPAVDNVPLWSPDGQRIVFASFREGTNLAFFWKSADGTGPVEHLVTTETSGFFVPYSWSPDGGTLVFNYGARAVPYLGAGDIGVLSMEGDRAWEPLLQTTADERAPAVSPDGAWIAYQSDQTGRPEVYVERFPGLGERRQISVGGGVEPLWSPDGSELFYRRLSPDAMMVVRIESDPVFQVSTAEILFEGRYYRNAFGRTYDITPDGKRFLMLEPAPASSEPKTAPHIVVVLDWFEELERLVPSN